MGGGAEKFVIGLDLAYAEIRYRREACSVCHQGALPLESALSLLPTGRQNAHPPAGVCHNLPHPACFYLVSLCPLQIMYRPDSSHKGVASRIGGGGGGSKVGVYHVIFIGGGGGGPGTPPQPHLNTLLSDPPFLVRSSSL